MDLKSKSSAATRSIFVVLALLFVSQAASASPAVGFKAGCYYISNFTQDSQTSMALGGTNFTLVATSISQAQANIGVNGNAFVLNVNQWESLGSNSNYSFGLRLINVSQGSAFVSLCAIGAPGAPIAAGGVVTTADQVTTTNATANTSGNTGASASAPAQSTGASMAPISAILPLLLGILAAIIIGYLAYSAGNDRRNARWSNRRRR